MSLQIKEPLSFTVKSAAVVCTCLLMNLFSLQCQILFTIQMLPVCVSLFWGVWDTKTESNTQRKDCLSGRTAPAHCQPTCG